MNDELKIIEQPEEIDIKLYVHQLASVQKMEELEEKKFVQIGRANILYTNMGVNGDITGYGKTLSMVTLVQRDRMNWDMNTDHEIEYIKTYDNSMFKKQSCEKFKKINTTLVLTSRSIIHQWINEFSHSNLNFVAVTSNKAATAIRIEEYDVIITSSSFFNIVANKGQDMVWKRFIFDEPTSVRVKSMTTVLAGFTWLVTATPGDIYKNNRSLTRSYLHSIIGKHDFHYDILPYIIVKNTEEFIKASFVMPPTTTLYYNCHDKIYRAVRGLVSDRITKMIEARNIAGAIEALGGVQTDNIVELVRKNKTIELEEIKSRIHIWTLRGDEEKRLEWCKKEQSLINQLAELDKRFGQIFQDSTCTICYEKLTDPIMEPTCQNVFCGTCLLSWLNTRSTCPLCRTIIDKSKLVYIKDKGGDEKKEEIKIEEEKIQTKESVILKIIKGGGKIIIFSDWYESFSTIYSLLLTHNIKYSELYGTSQTREKQLELFRNGNVNVIFVNSISDSCGINMQNATDIILYHQMSESARTQIIGRANRIGRDKPLTVHQLLSV